MTRYLPFVVLVAVLAAIAAITPGTASANDAAVVTSVKKWTVIITPKAQALGTLITRAERLFGRTLPVNAEARTALLALADGDGRYLLNLIQQLLALPNTEKLLDTAGLAEIVQKRAPLYDKTQESHYNLISALHKSMRGSDPDAALYWLARMLDGGEDPRYIARRLVRFANEDIGIADPQAMPQALAAWDVYERLGSPEGELAIAQAVVYLATAPKSIAVYRGFNSALKAAKQTGSLPPPLHILNGPTRLMKDLGYEHHIRGRLTRWAQLRTRKQQPQAPEAPSDAHRRKGTST
jgi:putative ATPase